MKRICVFCGASDGIKPVYRETAVKLGQLLAERKIELVYGGGNLGLMGIVADATLEAGGRVLGVTVRALVDREQAHTELNELFIVNTLHERKMMMATLSDGFIALPGGLGTLEEIIEILTWGQLGFHKKPSGFLNVEGYYDGLLSFFDYQVEQGFVQPSNRKLILTADSRESMLVAMATYVPVKTEKVIEREDL
jgi:uncharacterized protein (TIGR00730 family)